MCEPDTDEASTTGGRTIGLSPASVTRGRSERTPAIGINIDSADAGPSHTARMTQSGASGPAAALDAGDACMGHSSPVTARIGHSPVAVP